MTQRRPRSTRRSITTRDLMSLGLMSLLTGVVVGWQPPWLLGAVPASASTPTPGVEAPAQFEATDVNGSSVPGIDDASTDPVVFVPVDQRRTITIAGVGDILVHREIIAQALQEGGGTPDFGPQLAGVAELVSDADLAVCHIEFPLGSADGPWSAWPDTPNSPPQIAQAVADLGFDACSTASNHTLDQGLNGVISTINALEAVGLAHAGSAVTPAAADQTTLIDVNGVVVALLSYTYGFNGIPRPNDWCCNLIDPTDIISRAQIAKERGADVVVASLHFGVEGVAAPTDDQRELTQILSDSGLIDLVLGHHAHVVQPVTKVGDMWVAFGHGNLLSAQSRKDPRTGDGLLTTFTLAEQADGTFAVIDAVGFPIVNYDYPFSISPVPSYAEPGGRADATWSRVSEQALIPGDSSGFRLERFDG